MHLQPRLTLTTLDQREKIHKDALHLLNTVGIQVESETALDRFKAAGAPCEDGRVRIPRELVDRALDQAPSSVTIYNRLGEKQFELGGKDGPDAVFGVGVTNLQYQDPATGEINPFSRRDMARSAVLCQRLDSFDCIATPGVIQDEPPESADLYGVIEMAAHTVKPIILLISNSDCFDPALELCRQLGKYEDLAQHPWVVPYVNPITPLILNAETSRKMETAISCGLPLIYSNYGMSGATCPITPGGTLAVLTAELLAGLVYGQLIREGAPMILGSLPAAFDMQQAGSFYSPQSLLLNLACAEMMAHYHLPHCGTSGSGNGWGADLISAACMDINQFTACLGAPGLVPFVGGSFDSLVFSPELTVYADDVIETSRAFNRGFSIADEAVGLDEAAQLGPGGNYLLSPLTGKHFRESSFTSRIWAYQSLEKWKDRGQVSAREILKQKTLDLMAFPERAVADREMILEKGKEFMAGR